MHDPVAFRVAGILRGDNTADGTTCHGLTERERRDVRADVVHARTHVRVDGEVRVPDEDLAVGRFGDRRLGDLEEILIGEALRPGDEPDLAGDTVHAAMIRPWSRSEGICSSRGRAWSTRTSGARSCSSASTPTRAHSASC